MRNLSTPMITAITSNSVSPVILLDLTLSSGVYYLWSGIGSVTWNSQTYLGVGSLGSIGDISEGTEVRAEGTSITLSGIDPALLADSLADIQVGAPVTIWFGIWSAGAIISTPYPIYRGTVDKPTTQVSTDNLSITLNLENRMINLQRASMRKYTAADQRYYYPDDCGYNFVEMLNDISLRWGAS